MKRILSFLLMVAMLFCVGCAPEGNVADGEIESHNGSQVSLAEIFRNNINNYEDESYQFGKLKICFKKSRTMVASFQYPETDIDVLDRYIEQWLEEIYSLYSGICATEEDVWLPSYLTVTYDSYRVCDSIVSIRLKSNFLSPYASKPVWRMKSFGFDTRNNELLTTEDVFSKKAIEGFNDLVSEKTDIEVGDERNLLESWVMTDNGMKVALVHDGEIHDVDFDVFDLYSIMERKLYMRIHDERCGDNFNGFRGSDETEASQQPMIALTFDDGPSFYTEGLLDILDEYGVKATFFVLGSSIEQGAETLKRMSKEGHEIGSHSWEHLQLTKLTEGEIAEQINLTRKKIFETIGQDCFVMRPPYGEYDDKLKLTGRLYDVAFVNWSVDTLDWESKNAEAVAEEIMKSTKDGSIILCHDLYPSTLEGVKIAIPKLLEQGYRFVTVSELMSHSETPLEPGKLFYKK